MALPYPLPSERVLLSRPEHLALTVSADSKGAGAPRSTRPVNLDAAAVRQAWRVTGGNLAAAARTLGIHRATLYRYMKKLGLNRTNLE
jgi:sigma-54 specific flagellar transcriptional regulator A